MLAPACFLRRPSAALPSAAHYLYNPSRIPKQQLFSVSAYLRDDLPDHYDTLEVAPNASDKEIKRSFYKLSKSHHPDLHPDDAGASKRFVRISEAYAVLSSPTKRTTYDRDFRRVHQTAAAADPSSGSAAHPSGSFSSASTPAGGRPASGLSRRRTQFRGPPPSFYRSGGWGEHGAKRAEHASNPSHAWERTAGQEGGVGGGGGTQAPGTGPSGFARGLDDDVPHFDSRGHYQTHSTIEQTRHRARRRASGRAAGTGEVGGAERAGDFLFNFLAVSGILVVIFGLSGLVLGTVKAPVKTKGGSTAEAG